MQRQTYAAWLANELDRQGVSRRELGRRLAGQREDNGKYAEQHRRHIKRILVGDVVPTQRTRDAISDALGVPRDSAPQAADDEEESLSAILARGDLDAFLLYTAKVRRVHALERQA